MSRPAALALVAGVALAACTGGARPGTRPPDSPGPGALRWHAVVSASAYTSARAVAPTEAGGAIVAGGFEGTLTAGDRALEAVAGQDAFVARLSASGEVEWARALGGRGVETIAAVAVGPRGEVAVAGSMSERMTVAGTELAAAGSGDGFVAVLSASGEPRWATATSASDYASIEAVALAPDGGAIAGGYFAGTLRHGEVRLTSAGNHDLFVARWEPGGRPGWAHRGGGGGADAVHGVAARGDRVAIAGSIGGAADVLGRSLTASDGSHDGFVGAIDAAGAPVWIARIGGAGDDAALGVALSARGAIAVGSFTGRADVAGETLEASGPGDGFVAAYGPGGDPRWAAQAGGGGAAALRAVATSGGAIAVAGDFDRELAWNGERVASAGRHDAALAVLTADGRLRWVRRLGGEGQDSGDGVALGAGHAIAAGAFEARADLGGAPARARGEIAGYAASLAR